MELWCLETTWFHWLEHSLPIPLRLVVRLFVFSSKHSADTKITVNVNDLMSCPNKMEFPHWIEKKMVQTWSTTSVPLKSFIFLRSSLDLYFLRVVLIFFYFSRSPFPLKIQAIPCQWNSSTFLRNVRTVKYIDCIVISTRVQTLFFLYVQCLMLKWQAKIALDHVVE